MRRERPTLKLFIDEGVPDSVGRAFLASGHKVVYLRDAIATGSPDQLVCAVSEANDAILVALDATVGAAPWNWTAAISKTKLVEAFMQGNARGGSRCPGHVSH